MFWTGTAIMAVIVVAYFVLLNDIVNGLGNLDFVEYYWTSVWLLVILGLEYLMWRICRR